MRAANNIKNARYTHQQKIKNGLRNQFHLSPYKSLTAQGESARNFQKCKKSKPAQNLNQKTNPIKQTLSTFAKNPKKPKTAPDYQPQNPKKQPMPTPLTSSLLPLAPTYLSAQTDLRRALKHNPCLGFRIKSAWLTPSAERGLSQPPF